MPPPEALPLDRSRIVRIPSQEPHAPLLVLLHGLGGTEQDLLPWVPLLPGGFDVVAVRGPVDVPPGAGWLPQHPGSAVAEATDAGTSSLLDWLTEEAAGRSVALLGWSQGAAIAVHALRTAPSLVGTVAAIAGFLPGRADDAELERRRPRLLVAFGTADDVIPAHETRELLDWARQRTRLEERHYDGVRHEITAEQIRDAARFLAADLA